MYQLAIVWAVADLPLAAARDSHEMHVIPLSVPLIQPPSIGLMEFLADII